MYNLTHDCQILNLDKIYQEYFGLFVNKKIFVEIGAHNGESFSNTSFLADAGWRGIYVEPVHSHYIECLERHKNNNVVVSNLAIGLEEGVQKMYVNDVLTTLDTEQASIAMEKFMYPQYTEEYCYQIRMDRFLENYNVEYNFDLLVVDVEGGEDGVFYSFDLGKWSPKMMIVELVDCHEYFQESPNIIMRTKQLRNHINSFGYTEIYRDRINTIFVKK